MQELLDLFESVPTGIAPEDPTPADVCPFPAVNALGEKLVRWGRLNGQLFAVYAVPLIRYPKCWKCDSAIPAGPSGTGRAISINPVSGAMAWACEACATAAGARADEMKVSGMATAMRERHLPDCRVCGLGYVEGHHRPVTSIWAAYGPEDGHGYRPAIPFRERGWPHRLITDYDHDTDRVIYADEAHNAAA